MYDRLDGMPKRLMLRPLTDAELTAIRAGLRASDAFVLRRCQILLASRDGRAAQAIADQLHCDDETVRRVITAFHQRGLASLTRGSSRPQRTRDLFTPEALLQLGALVRQSPRIFNRPTSVWTLDGVADVAFAEGLTPHRVSDETIRKALMRLGLRWRQAKQWIASPDPQYGKKNANGTA